MRWKDANHIDPDDPNAGEDYTGYRIAGCEGVEKWPDGKEPLNHFADGMYGGGPAFESYVRFYLDAVNLWKQGKRAEAAFILGRALHLIEDMAQPQHAMNEEHYPFHQLRWHGLPIPWTFGHFNPSFLEAFTEAHITDQNGYPTTLEQDFCLENGGYPDYTALIGDVDAFGCQFCSQPLDYFFDSAHKSEALRAPAGPSFNTSQLRTWFPSLQIGPLGNSLELPFQFVDAPCGTKEYKQSRDYTSSDFFSASINSIDLGYRLKEGQSGAAAFGAWHTNALLKSAVADVAGVIAAFWNEVKNANPNPKPCAPPSPAGDTPDDSAQVRSSVVAASNTMPASSDWHNICRVGISKGLPTMADYGVSSSLFDQIAALDPNTDPSVAEALYSRLEAFEQKYSGPQNMMPKEVEEAPYVAVWASGFAEGARLLV
jgi:hypothetical protein